MADEAPTGATIKAATDELRKEATSWSTQAGVMRTIAGTMSKLQIDRADAGLFQTWFDKYIAIVTQIADRTKEATTAFDGVSKTLGTIADTYDAEEAKKVHALKKLY